MIPLFVNLVIMIGLIASVGMAVYSYQRSAETVSLAQRNAARMEQVAYAIRGGLRPALMNGPVLVPLGDPDGPPVAVALREDGKTAVNPAEQVCIDGLVDYAAGHPTAAFNQNCRRMTVPRWLVSDDRTPWGGRYAFCPYAPTAYGDAPAGALPSLTGFVRDAGSASYRIRTVTQRGRSYVLQSDPGPIRAMGAETASTTTAAEEIVGFLLSPPPHVRDKAPRCQDVVKADGAWIVVPSEAGAAEGSHPGSVVPILSRGIGAGQVANQGEVVLYADADGSGLKTGDRPDDALPLKEALDLWHLTPWRSATIRVKGGSYAFGPADTVPGSTLPRLALATVYPGRALRIDSADENPVLLTSSGAPIDLAPGIDLTLDSVSLGEGVQLRPLEGSRVFVSNGAMRHVRVDGGDLTLGRGTSVTADPAVSPFSAIDVISGRLRLSAGSAGPGILAITGAPAVGIQMFGGDLVLNGTGIAAELATGGTTVTQTLAARVLVSPAPDGSWPTIRAEGGGRTAGGVLGGEMTAHASTTGGGCDPNTGTCVATCQTATEEQAGLRPLRIAVAGSCSTGNSATPEGRASLMTSANGLQVTGDPGSWACAWRSGDRYVQSPIAGGGVRVGSEELPALAVTARCLPNPSLTLPLGAVAGAP